MLKYSKFSCVPESDQVSARAVQLCVTGTLVRRSVLSCVWSKTGHSYLPGQYETEDWRYQLCGEADKKD